MKKISILSLLIGAMLLLVGCSSSEKDAGKVAIQFAEALNMNDFKGASSLTSSEEVRGMLNLLESFYNSAKESGESISEPEAKKYVCETTEKLAEDSYKFFVVEESKLAEKTAKSEADAEDKDDAESRGMSITVGKVDGEWKVTDAKLK